MEIGRRDYTEGEVTAARQVLTELAHILSEYWNGVVVVGGWVPYFAIPQAIAPHEGTKDVDLALDSRKLSDSGYSTIGESLMQNLYQQDTRKPFRYYRKVTVNGRQHEVIVDFLTGENDGRAQNAAIQDIQDVATSTMHGCDVAFLDPVEMEFVGQHPGGGQDNVTVRVASIQTFLVMKGLALHSRGGEDGRKDAYDIYYCVKYFPGGIETLAARFQPLLSNPLVQEGLAKIAGSFASLEHIGPKWVGDRADNDEERDLLRRDLLNRSTHFYKDWGS